MRIAELIRTIKTLELNVESLHRTLEMNVQALVNLN